MGVENQAHLVLTPKQVVCDVYGCPRKHIPRPMVFDGDEARRSAQAVGWFAPLAADNDGATTWCPVHNGDCASETQTPHDIACTLQDASGALRTVGDEDQLAGDEAREIARRLDLVADSVEDAGKDNDRLRILLQEIRDHAATGDTLPKATLRDIERLATNALATPLKVA